MNKRTIKTVERRMLKSMREDEIQLKLLLGTETDGCSGSTAGWTYGQNRAVSWQNYGQSEQANVTSRPEG